MLGGGRPAWSCIPTRWPWLRTLRPCETTCSTQRGNMDAPRSAISLASLPRPLPGARTLLPLPFPPNYYSSLPTIGGNTFCLCFAPCELQSRKRCPGWAKRIPLERVTNPVRHILSSRFHLNSQLREGPRELRQLDISAALVSPLRTFSLTPAWYFRRLKDHHLTTCGQKPC